MDILLQIAKLSALVLAMLAITSCIPRSPYEAKSICVSTESSNPWVINPCIRKIVNSQIIS